MSVTSMTHALRALPRRDKALLGTLIVLALGTLAIGVFAGVATALSRAGIITSEAELGYRWLTLHGFTVFFYWLYFAQSAALLALVAVEAAQVRGGLALRPVAWLGVAGMAAGLIVQHVGAWFGTPLLYDGSPEIAVDEPANAALFYAGYLLLGFGLLLIAAVAIVTALRSKASRSPAPWSALGFGAVGWAGLVIVSSMAIMMTFLPAFLWSIGWGAAPVRHSTSWHLLFHNLHYLPLMGTVLIWYALASDLTGMRSIFGQHFSKLIFASYLVVVPPTSLYHMFLEPDLAPTLRALGSLLSLFISVPTIAAFLVIVGSLEVLARERGLRGLFGWLRMLPWREPAVPAVAMSVVNLALGGMLSFVLIQERFASLLSDTFFVPAYFHFLTIGTVTLTLLAMVTRLMPEITGRPLSSPRTLCLLPYVVSAGLIIFGASGVLAGLMGMPRRVMDATYGGASPDAWPVLSAGVGLGGTIMAGALLTYVVILGRSFLGRGAVASPRPDDRERLGRVGVGMVVRRAWAGPLCVLVLVAGMFAATIFAFDVLGDLPIETADDGGH